MWVIGSLLCGSGLRLLECLTLRIKDIDLDRGEIKVRAGKGNKDRITMIPDAVKSKLHSHLAVVRPVDQRDAAAGIGVLLPGALGRKYPRSDRNGLGTGCSRPIGSIATSPPAIIGVIIFTNLPSSERSSGPSWRLESQAGHRPHSAALVCNPLAGIGLRHSNRAGAFGPLGCEYHHDLHPCPEPGRARGVEPDGRPGWWRGGRGLNKVISCLEWRVRGGGWPRQPHTTKVASSPSLRSTRSSAGGSICRKPLPPRNFR